MPTTRSCSTRRAPWRLLVALLLAAVAGTTMQAAGPAGASPVPPPVPAPLPCHLTDFSTASVETLASPDPSGPDHRLTVTGTLRLPARVSLVKLTYVRQPEFWGIEVTACPFPTPFPRDPSVLLPARTFRAVLDFRGTLGTCGVEVIGLTVRQAINLTGPPACPVVLDPPPIV
jgi:hypothetical protein